MPPRPSLVALANLVVLGAWLLLHERTLVWLAARFVGAPLHAGILLVAVVLLARGRRVGAVFLAAIHRVPVPSVVPLALVVSASAAHAVLERIIDTSTLSALLFGAGVYGLAGLVVDGATFRRALPAALLLIVLLPFGEQADTYLGFTARVSTARLVAGLLAAMGRATLPVETILLLENGAAHIDAPCSGARGLWTGLLFFLAATCVLRRRPGVRWAFIGAVYAALLFVENAVRVAAVVLLAAGLGLLRVAELLHAPLGVMGFALVSAFALVLLRRYTPSQDRGSEGPRLESRWGFLAPALAGFFLVLFALPRRHRVPEPASRFLLALDPALEARPLPLTTAEVDLFRRWGGAADKRRFRAGGREGSLLAVFGRTWRAHHPPEVCLAGSGVRIDGLRHVFLDGASTVCAASADGGKRTAVYWFQSPTRVTSDLTSRIWDDLSGRERRWVQISMLIDSPLLVESPEGRSLIDAVRGAAARALAEETPR